MDAKSYFLNPTEPRHRHYEALRAIYAGDLSRDEAARQFGLAPSYLKKLNAEFQQALGRGEAYFFAPPPKGPPKGPRCTDDVVERIVALRKKNHSVPDIQAILTAQELPLALTTIDRILKDEGFAPLPKRTREERAAAQVPARIQAPESEPFVWREETFTTEHGGGVLVFLPLLEQLGVMDAIARAGFPKTSVLSAQASVLSFLALKLLGNDRISHDAPYNLDRALGLFAGLNVLPKSSTLSSYSYRISREQNRTLLGQLCRLFEDKNAELGDFNMDFKAIPHWGDASVLENNWSGMRHRRVKSLLALLVQCPDTGILFYSDAGIRHRNENGAVLEFLDFWKNERGTAPKMLIFDSRFTTYENLDKLNKDGIKFLTLRRRGKNLVDQIQKFPENEWKRIELEGTQRKHPKVRVHDSRITLRHYTGPIRQIVLTEHGREQPAFLISNEEDLDTGLVIKKYARRWLVEQEIAEQIDFFHLNSPSSSIVVKVDFDLTLSLFAHNLFRTLTRQLPGFERCTVATIARDVLQNGAIVSIKGRDITVQLKKKAHLPTLFELPWMKQRNRLAWMDATIAFETATTS